MVALTAFDWDPDGERHTAYLDRDGHVHDLSLGPLGWSYDDLTERLNAPLAVGTALAGYGLSAGYGLTPWLGIAYVDGYGHVHDCLALPGMTP